MAIFLVLSFICIADTYGTIFSTIIYSEPFVMKFVLSSIHQITKIIWKCRQLALLVIG